MGSALRRLAVALAFAPVLAWMSAPAAWAIQIPAPGGGDPRVRVVDYTPGEVVLITATLGYAVTLDFGEDEKIETVSVGDGLTWQLTPNRRANLLFVKPMAAKGATNMTVVTTLRVYHFELRARARSSAPHDSQLVFAVRFSHPPPAVVTAAPEPEPAPPAPPKAVNTAYSFDGAPSGAPVRVFDDGVSTYFKFADTAEIPAILAIDRDRKENVVNVANRDGFMVVDRLAPGFVLRRGSTVTRIFNDAYRADAQTPTELPRHGKRSKRKHEPSIHD